VGAAGAVGVWAETEDSAAAERMAASRDVRNMRCPSVR
jgi:hypothetical protein